MATDLDALRRVAQWMDDDEPDDEPNLYACARTIRDAADEITSLRTRLAAYAVISPLPQRSAPGIEERLMQYRAAAWPLMIGEALSTNPGCHPGGSFDPGGTQTIGSGVAQKAEAWAHAMLAAERKPEGA